MHARNGEPLAVFDTSDRMHSLVSNIASILLCRLQCDIAHNNIVLRHNVENESKSVKDFFVAPSAHIRTRSTNCSSAIRYNNTIHYPTAALQHWEKKKTSGRSRPDTPHKVYTLHTATEWRMHILCTTLQSTTVALQTGTHDLPAAIALEKLMTK